MTRGADRLRELLAKRGEQKKFTDTYNAGRPVGQRIDQPMVSRWVRGLRVPGRDQMARIEDLTRIPMRDWVAEAKPARRKRKAA